MGAGFFYGKVRPEAARSDDAQLFGHNTAALAVLITLQRVPMIRLMGAVIDRLLVGCIVIRSPSFCKFLQITKRKCQTHISVSSPSSPFLLPNL